MSEINIFKMSEDFQCSTAIQWLPM